MKPEKHSYFEFLVKPIVDMFAGFILQLKYHIGYWNCGKCKKLYSPRVKKKQVDTGEPIMFGKFRRKITVCSVCENELNKEAQNNE